MSEWKPTKPENPDFHCTKCGSHEMWYRCIDEVHDDIRYRCGDCGDTFVAEGPDA
jgi:predicted SprT family Zn-dependent metalloprotease